MLLKTGYDKKNHKLDLAVEHYTILEHSFLQKFYKFILIYSSSTMFHENVLFAWTWNEFKMNFNRKNSKSYYIP